MLIKSLEKVDHVKDLKEAFKALCQHQIMLNPSKYTFGVITGMFLEFLVTKQDIETNSEKIQVILDVRHPTSKK